MVGVVNPPSGETITDYTNAAMNVARVSSPATMIGGVLTSINEAAGSTITSMSSSVTTGSGGPLQPATTTSNTGTSGSHVDVPQKVSKRKVLNLVQKHIEPLDRAKRDLEAEKQEAR
jgi:hypothetical protein